jgi:glutamate synthase (NADPH/NADH) large chain/glutamate synthase (ferredoxin)
MNHVIQDRVALLGPSMYRPEYEHDACGVGFIAQKDGIKSNKVLNYALESLCNLAHRGAIDADQKTGDGAGVLTQLPYKLFEPDLAKLGVNLADPAELGVGMFFLPHRDADAQRRAKAIAEDVLASRGVKLFGWRVVPLNLQVLGNKAAETLPEIEQVLVGRPAGMNADEY